MNQTKPLPTQRQLLLPMLEVLDELGAKNGKTSKASEVIETLSNRFEIPREVQEDYRPQDLGRWGTRNRCPWRQTVHWVRQNGITQNLISKGSRGHWGLTEKGEKTLANCTGGIVLVIYETPSGQAVWAEAQTAAGALSNNSLQLIFTSPPYPILRGRDYGTFSEAEIIELIVSCAKEWQRALTHDGSLVLNLKDTWLPKSMTGGAVRSLYQEKLLLALCEDVGLHFADRHYWRNPSHSPESAWVTVKKVRCNQDVEQIFWLSRSPNPYADTREVMAAAKESTIRTYQLRAARKAITTTGPSGQKSNFEEQMAAVASGQVLKVIPRNLLEISNADTHKTLRGMLADADLPRHDAMMPLDLAKFFIKMLTRPKDTVYDPFFGSGTTGVAAESLGRPWLGSDRSLAHLLGSALRFPQHTFEPA